MKFPSTLILFALSLIGSMCFSQGTNTQPTQKQGSEENKSASPPMQLYNVPQVRESSDETPEEATDYLKVSRISDPASGVQLIEDFLKKYPSSKRAPLLHYGAVTLYQQLNNYDKLVEHGEKFLETSPSNINVLSTVGLAYASHGESDKAVEKASKAITLLNDLTKPAGVSDETRWNMQRNQLLAMNYASLGMSAYAKFEEERKKEKEASAGTEGKGQPTPSAGAVSGKEAGAGNPKPAAQTPSPAAIDLAKALGYFVKALEYEPRYDYAQFQLGVVYAYRNQVDLAIDSFAKAVVIGGGFAALAKQNLEAVYKVKNKNSLDGIEQVLAKAKEELLPIQPSAPAKP